MTIARGVRQTWSEKSYKVDQVEEYLSALGDSAPDVFMSQATFVQRGRGVALMHTLRCAFVDLDLYNVDMRADDASIEAVLQHARAAGVPEPSMVVRSGQGLYAKWVFDRPITSTLMPQWQALQRVLMAMYRQFGSDPKVRDAARVMRTAGSVNTKNGAQVSIALDTGRTWDFGELCARVAQIEPALSANWGAKTVRTARARQQKLQGAAEISDLGHLATYAAKNEPFMLKRMSAQSLNWSRFLDLRDLAMRRGGFARGCRDQFLFWMANFLSHAGVITPDNFWNEISSMLLAFPVSQDFDPLNDGSMSTLQRRLQAAHEGKHISFKGSKMSPLYTPSNDYLLDAFQISPEEEQQLRTLISGAERQRRADAKVPGRAERRTQRTEARAVAVSLAEQGARIEDICASVGRSRSTVYGWIAAARKKQQEPAEAAPHIETRGRKSRWAVHQQQLPPGAKDPQQQDEPPAEGKQPYRYGQKILDAQGKPTPLRWMGRTGTTHGLVPKIDPSQMNAAEERRRTKPAAPAKPPSLDTGQVTAWVKQRLQQIQQRAGDSKAREELARQQDARERLAQAIEETRLAQAALRAHVRLWRIAKRAQLAPADSSSPACRLKPDRRPGRLVGSQPRTHAPPAHASP